MLSANTTSSFPISYLNIGLIQIATFIHPNSSASLNSDFDGEICSSNNNCLANPSFADSAVECFYFSGYCLEDVV